MMRLTEPQYSFEQSLIECIAGITGNAALREKVTISRPNLIEGAAHYLAAAAAGKLYAIAPINAAQGQDPRVVNDLTKSELIKIYDQYFVPPEKPARKIYNELLNSAKEKCPFCGGIGTPRNLDHFLPKAHFPQFSFAPQNLVPACRDCNMNGKMEAYATTPEAQFIHPYSDSSIFFQEQWIFAKYHVQAHDVPGHFEYAVLPPGGWNEIDKRRVKKHFLDFDLGKRYSIKAAELLGTILQQISRLQNSGMGNETISAVLIQPGIEKAPFINHWQTGMFQSLKDVLQ